MSCWHQYIDRPYQRVVTYLAYESARDFQGKTGARRMVGLYEIQHMILDGKNIQK